MLLAGRANKPDLYDSDWDPPAPLVPRSLIFGVRERLDYSGTVVVPLDLDDVAAVARRLRELGVEAVAICFLNSFMNGDHEAQAKEIVVAELPDAFVCTSHEVLPEIEESEVSINPEDLKVETLRAGGAGGQHVNKTESAVRITHLPTGIVVSCQNERSQHKNRASAMSVLLARLSELERTQSQDKINALKGDGGPAAWGRQIRSYVMQPYTMVKDHRTGHETANVSGVLDGEIDGFIEAFAACDGNRKKWREGKAGRMEEQIPSALAGLMRIALAQRCAGRRGPTGASIPGALLPARVRWPAAAGRG